MKQINSQKLIDTWEIVLAPIQILNEKFEK